MHKFTTEIKIDGRIVYPISMLATVVGEENIRKHHNLTNEQLLELHGDTEYMREELRTHPNMGADTWWLKNGSGCPLCLEGEYKDTIFHCWKDGDEIMVEGLGAMGNGLKGEKVLESVEQMWDDWGDENHKPIFYYTLMG